MRKHAAALAQESVAFAEDARDRSCRASETTDLADELELLLAQYAEAVPATDTTTSPAGTEVQHVDGEVQDEKTRFVWLGAMECTGAQQVFAVGRDDTGPALKLAIPLDQCTPEQLVGRTVCEL